MLYRPLGRTGLMVSVLGLGTGKRFGDPKVQSSTDAHALVRAAVELGINYIDTAPMYLEAEARLGAALAGVPRERFILATKFFPADAAGQPISREQLRASVEQSLRNLRLETVDILQIHGLRPHWLKSVLAELGEELENLRREGKYRWLGVAETIAEDPRHEMVPAAAGTGRFATALVAYGPLSPWAELSALPAGAAAGIGVVAMVAVRQALRDPACLARLLQAARERGELGPRELTDENPLDWLLHEHAPTLAAAGYRFALSHPAVAAVLSGTLNRAHLAANAAAVCAPPMPLAQLERVRRIFLNTNPEHWKPIDL